MRSLTNQAGAVVATYTYDAYGTTTASTGSVTNPFRYTGQYQDAESGLYYLRARYYDPASQQFLTRDPLVAATEQAYNYAGGSPLNATDPSGLRYSYGNEGGLYGDEEAFYWYKKHGGIPDAGWGAIGRWWDNACQAMQDRVAVLRILQEFSDAAGTLDRNGYTFAGRALRKHSDRPGSAWQQYKPSGTKPEDYNQAAQDLVDDILSDPKSTWSTRLWSDNGKMIEVIEARAPDGRGLRYRNTDGSFVGFLEP